MSDDPIVGTDNELPPFEYKYVRVIVNCGPYENVPKDDGSIWNPNLDDLLSTSWVEPLSDRQVRWCETHDCEHMFKDACSRRMVAFGRREDGAVNLGEQVDGPKECVEGWRTMVTPE